MSFWNWYFLLAFSGARFSCKASVQLQGVRGPSLWAIPALNFRSATRWIPVGVRHTW